LFPSPLRLSPWPAAPSLSTTLCHFSKLSGRSLSASPSPTPYFGGRPIIDRFGSKIGISWKLIEKIRADFQKSIRDEIFILVSCSIPIVPVSLVSAFCGGFRFLPAKFYPLVFLALLIRATILGFVGFQMGETFTSLAHGLDKIESLLTVIGAIMILGFLYLKREQWLKANS